MTTITDTATFCATLVDEWARAGVHAAFVAPGSRSTPVALALAADDRLAVHVFHDERSAAFAALGHGIVSGTPAVIVCTSGTAAAHFHAAVIEADLSSVPLIVCTTDRPPELWDVGAPQTIDQTHLYGRSVRHFVEPGVPDPALAPAWRSMASRLVVEALGSSGRAGPVHANVSFRDPLVGTPGPLPVGRADGAPWHTATGRAHTASAADLAEVAARCVDAEGRTRRGVVLAGHGTDGPDDVVALAAALGWPLLADHRSGARRAGVSVGHADVMLRSERFATATRPEVVLRFGEPPASKFVSLWLSAAGPEVVQLGPPARWSDPERLVTATVTGHGTAAALLSALPTGLTPSSDADRWLAADAAAAEAIVAHCAGATTGAAPVTPVSDEVTVARRAVAEVPSGGALVLSSSMPVRDVEWYGQARHDITVVANRGANGIDGVVSTAIGVALTGRATTLLIGDVAFLHDSAGLVALRHRRLTDGSALDLHIVVIDNDGGGIFSFLPQAELLASERYELLFGTPHDTDIVALCRAHGLEAAPWGASPATEPSSRHDHGVRISVVTSERGANRDAHERLNAAIVAAAEVALER